MYCEDRKLFFVLATVLVWSGYACGAEQKRSVEQEEKSSSCRDSVSSVSQLRFQQWKKMTAFVREQSQLLQAATDPHDKSVHRALLRKGYEDMAFLRHIWVGNLIRFLGIEESGAHTKRDDCNRGDHRLCQRPYSSISYEDLLKGAHNPCDGRYDIWNKIREFVVGGVPTVKGGPTVYSPIAAMLCSQQLMIGRRSATVTDVSPSPLGTDILVGYSDGIVRQYDVRSGMHKQYGFQGKLAGHGINSFSWVGTQNWRANSLHPDGYACSGNIKLKLGRHSGISERERELAATPLEEQELIQNQDFSRSALTISFNGQRIFEVDNDEIGNGYIVVYDVHGGMTQMRGEPLEHDKPIFALKTDRVGARLVCAEPSGDRFVVWRDGSRELETIEVSPSHEPAPIAVDMDAEGKRAVLLSHGEAHVIDISAADSAFICSINLPNKEACYAAELIKGGTKLLTTSSRGTIRIYSVEQSPQCLEEIRSDHELRHTKTHESEAPGALLPDVHDTVKRCLCSNDLFITYAQNGYGDVVRVYNRESIPRLEACTQPQSLYFATQFFGLINWAKRLQKFNGDRAAMRVCTLEQPLRLLQCAPIGDLSTDLMSHARRHVMFKPSDACSTSAPGKGVLGKKRKQQTGESSSVQDVAKRAK